MTWIDRKWAAIKAACKRDFDRTVSVVHYIENRLAEKSTWVGIGAAVTGAAALEAPYSWLVIGAGVIAILVPTS